MRCYECSVTLLFILNKKLLTGIMTQPCLFYLAAKGTSISELLCIVHCYHVFANVLMERIRTVIMCGLM